jgi:hypothetical protein
MNSPKTVTLLILLTLTLSASGQGIIYFQNRGGAYNGELDEKIFHAIERNALAGDRFSAQLWIARTVDSLEPVLQSTTTFRTGAAAGYVVPLATVIVPGILPGETVWVQVRAWENSPGVTGWGNASIRGESNLFTVVLGGDGFYVPIIAGMKSFEIVPEPSAFALGILAFAFALLKDRSRRLSV